MDDHLLVTIELALSTGTLAAEMNRQGLLSPEARTAIAGSLKRFAEKLDFLDEPNAASVDLNSLANALLRGP